MAERPLRQTALNEWSPRIHYAQFQTLAPCQLPLRRLYDYELLYVCQGELVTEMRGREYRLSSGELIFLAAGVYHQNRIVSAPSARLLGIHFDFFGELTIQGEEDLVVREEDFHADKLASEGIAGNDLLLSAAPVYKPSMECVQWMERISDEFAKRPLGYELVCKGLMLEILAHLLRLQMTGRMVSASVHGERIRQLTLRMEEAPADNWSSKRIADFLLMSEDYAIKTFRQIVGAPPGEYVRQIRHREARKLLRETDLSIEQIGVQVGYPELHYFSRLFSSSEGISPRAYRKLSRVL